MTLSIVTATLYHSAECKYAECRILFAVVLSVIMLNVVILNVVILNIVILNLLILNVIILKVIILNVCQSMQPQMLIRSAEKMNRGRFVEQNLMLSSSFRCDQI